MAVVESGVKVWLTKATRILPTMETSRTRFEDTVWIETDVESSAKDFRYHIEWQKTNDYLPRLATCEISTSPRSLATWTSRGEPTIMSRSPGNMIYSSRNSVSVERPLRMRLQTTEEALGRIIGYVQLKIVFTQEGDASTTGIATTSPGSLIFRFRFKYNDGSAPDMNNCASKSSKATPSQSTAAHYCSRNHPYQNGGKSSPSTEVPLAGSSSGPGDHHAVPPTFSLPEVIQENVASSTTERTENPEDTELNPETKLFTAHSKLEKARVSIK
ncbi:hypothetical protein D9757_008787 [Collybiopsis confluens]|uniref:Uncharacterized protein n=1 Tax=Collybiopsis confluens TaxID=2823264 RepID=A0A8H5H5T2_9AGAR|nr:hypothetical protein D9757_008787 [Collybiopsis confluens]